MLAFKFSTYYKQFKVSISLYCIQNSSSQCQILKYTVNKTAVLSVRFKYTVNKTAVLSVRLKYTVYKTAVLRVRFKYTMQSVQTFHHTLHLISTLVLLQPQNTHLYQTKVQNHSKQYQNNMNRTYRQRAQYRSISFSKSPKK